MNIRRLKGYLLGFVAAATYGLNPLFALPLMAEGLDTSSILFFRYLLAIPVVALLMVARGRSFGVGGRTLGLLAVFGLLVGVSSIALFESYRYMQAGIASTILFVYPLMVAVIMAGFFHEKVTPVTVFSLGAAMTGIGMLYKGGDGVTLSLTGTMLALVSALSYALYIVGVNKTRIARVPTLTVTFYVLVFGLTVFLVNIVAGGSLAVPHGAAQWGRVACLAVLPTAISFLCTTAAIVYIGSTPTAILGALEPLTAVVVGITVFGEVLTFTDVIGLVLILVAVIFVILGGSVGHPLTVIRRMFPRRHRSR